MDDTQDLNFIGSNLINKQRIF